MKGASLMDPRDMVLAKFTECGSDFATILNCSIKVAERPEVKGCVRADQHVNYLVYC